ncbi:hypothetical protein OHB49_38905 [Streptomyces sp. NBC_01717]|uniref:hypothetical protein n=1 Tax=Streptomyces sp. NBC_01717 TaxID=2975918 RepID=UPI002E37F346|nr:hypothetical protein [Streptomyces sp. NBC_01717]
MASLAMRRSLIALTSAGAIALVMGGYAVGAAEHDSTSERSTTCEQAKREFETRAGQIRRQLRLESQEGETDSHQITIDTTRAEIIRTLVEQNPTCFDAGTRAAAAVQEHPSEGQADAAVCDLTGIEPENCSVAAD